MIEALQQLGLSKAEADAYVYVLDVGVAPARDVATHIGQTPWRRGRSPAERRRLRGRAGYLVGREQRRHAGGAGRAAL